MAKMVEKQTGTHLSVWPTRIVSTAGRHGAIQLALRRRESLPDRAQKDDQVHRRADGEPGNSQP